MKKYMKPELEVVSFRTQENIAALKEYYYEATPSGSATSYKVSLFQMTSDANSNGLNAG